MIEKAPGADGALLARWQDAIHCNAAADFGVARRDADNARLAVRRAAIRGGLIVRRATARGGLIIQGAHDRCPQNSCLAGGSSRPPGVSPGHLPETPRVEIVDSLDDFAARVHDEGAVADDRLAKRLAA